MSASQIKKIRTPRTEHVSPNTIVINEIQLILAEKRTALSTMRTGIAVFVLPLSVFSFLIAFSKFFNPLDTLIYFIPLAAITTSLIVLGSYLIVRSFIKIHHHDAMIRTIKKQNKLIADLMD